jgi:large subunit ribosomal protein L7e
VKGKAAAAPAQEQKQTQQKPAAKPAAKPVTAAAASSKPAAKPVLAAAAAPAVKGGAAKPQQAAAAPAPAAAPAKVAGGKVPESVLKKRRTVDEIKAKKAVRAAEKSKKAKTTRRVIFKRAEKYVKEYRIKEKETIRLKRQAKNNLGFYVPPAAKVLLVVRIRGINRMAPKSKKILQLLRLRQIGNAVFVRVNKATMNMINVVEPYITYGPPTVATVQNLIYKRGHAKVDRQRIPIATNAVIANSLGKFDIICVEDLIHEITTCGPHFKEANNFLWPFKLSAPLGGFVQKRRHYSEGGDAGNREEDINQLVARMN